MTRFKDFAHSPYFNKHEVTQRLAGYLSKAYPTFSKNRLDRRMVFESVFPEREFDFGELALVFTYLTRLLLKFLLLEGAARSGLWERWDHLLCQLREREALLLYPPVMEQAQAAFAEGEEKENARAGDMEALATELDRCMVALGKYDPTYLSVKQERLTAGFLVIKFRDACELLQRSKLLATNPVSDPLLALLLTWADGYGDEFEHFLTVAIYHRIYKLLSTGTAEDYAWVLHFVEQHQYQLTFDDLQTVYNYLQNFCIEQINRGSEDFLEKLYQLYLVQLDKQLFFVNGYLPEWHYKNIVTTGLRMGQAEWVRNFIETYKDHLPPSVAHNAYSFNLAAWHYWQGQLPQVLGLLLRVEYTDLRYHLDAKALLLKTYYDLEEEEALLALTEAFRQLLKRNHSLSDFQKKGYYNLLTFTRRAFRLKVNYGITRADRWMRSRARLQNDLQNAQTIFNRSWLEMKVRELFA